MAAWGVLRLAAGVILNLIISTNPFLAIILLRVTPTAKRNSYRVAILVGHYPGERAVPATLGYEIATPSELPGVRTSCFQQKEMNNSGPSTTFIKGREKQYTIG